VFLLGHTAGNSFLLGRVGASTTSTLPLNVSGLESGSQTERVDGSC